MPYLGITMESVTAGIASAKLVFSRLAAEEKQNRCQTQPVSLSAIYQVQQHVVLFLVFLFPFLIVRQNQDSVGVNRRQKGSAHRPASPNNASALFPSAAATSGRVVRDPSFQPGPLLLSTNNNNRGPTLRAVLRRPQGTLLWRFPTGYRSCCLYYLLPMFGEPFFFFTMYCIKSFGSRCLFYPEFPCVQIQAQPPSVKPPHLQWTRHRSLESRQGGSDESGSSLGVDRSSDDDAAAAGADDDDLTSGTELKR